MKLIKNINSVKLMAISLFFSLFIIYPDFVCMNWELSQPDHTVTSAQKSFLFFNYFFFAFLTWILLTYNYKVIKDAGMKVRVKRNLVITISAYCLLVLVMYYWTGLMRTAGGIVLLQYFIVHIFATFFGHTVMMFNYQLDKEQEIRQLKTEQLQSRYDALKNQINPHFFFNSLNGLTSLIRKKNDEHTLSFVNKMSDVFRYILQSDKKSITTLKEEIEFLDAFKYMLEIRFANKLEFDVKIAKQNLNYIIPVLSLLPLIDNIVVHNVIDSLHKMTVTIETNDRHELVVSNPIYRKIEFPLTNGTGLANLESRYLLLMQKQIRVENDGKIFSVALPLEI